MNKPLYPHNADVSTIDYMYKAYSEDPQSVDESWRYFFEGFHFAQTAETSVSQNSHNGELEKFRKEVRVIRMIDSYRSRGHLFTKTNPVRRRKQHSPNITLERFEPFK